MSDTGIGGDSKATVAAVKQASREGDWARAIALGEAAIAAPEASAPSVLYRALAKAYRSDGRPGDAIRMLALGWRATRDGSLIGEMTLILKSPAIGAEDRARAFALFDTLAEEATNPDEAFAEAGREMVRLRRSAVKAAIAEAVPDEVSGNWAEAMARLREVAGLYGADRSSPVRNEIARAEKTILADLAGAASAAAERSDWLTAMKLWRLHVELAGDDAPDRHRRYVERARGKFVRGTAVLSEGAAGREDWRAVVSLWRRVFDEAHEAVPAAGYAALANAYRQLGSLEDSEAVIAEGVERYPNEISVHKEAALIASDSRRWALAAERWSHLLSWPVPQRSAAYISRKIASALVARIQEDPDGAPLPRLPVGRGEGLDLVEAAAEGIRALRRGQFEQALQAWRRYYQAYGRDRPDDDAFSIAGSHSREGNAAFRVLTPHRLEDGPRTGDAFCVYTVVTGGYDRIRPPLYRPEGVRFICFADADVDAPGWEVRRLRRGDSNAALASREVKLLPHRFLEAFRWSLYLDANVQLTADVALLHAHWLADRAFVAWSHPVRSDVYDECETILTKCRQPAEETVRQYEFFRAEGLPRNTGLIEAMFMWRDHQAAELRGLMEDWWAFLKRFGYRDQPALGYLMWKTGVRPEIMPPDVGTTRRNPYFLKYPHRHAGVDEVAFAAQ